jgi:hypothetical protein
MTSKTVGEIAGELEKASSELFCISAPDMRALAGRAAKALRALESQTVTAEDVKRASIECARVPIEEFWGCVAATLNRAKHGKQK